MRILVFGANGMLGHKLYQSFSQRFDVYGTIRGDFGTVLKYGIFDPDRIIQNVEAFDRTSIKHAIETVKPDCVINAIGVIKQLPTSKDVIQTLSINSIFPHILAELSLEFGFRLITISTDCVFDGTKGKYSETDAPDARDLYGLSKLLGEITANGALTIRTSIIGRELETGHSIVEWFLHNRGGSVKGFTKAIYTGFPTVIFADILTDVIANRNDLTGVWHISSDPISKHDLLNLLDESYKTNITVEPSEAVVIDRSLDSSRFRSKTGFEPAPWKEMVAAMASDPTPYGSWAASSTTG